PTENYTLSLHDALPISEETGMKPRDNVMQGGGAATTDPRKPDYANLYVMKDVNWDDPTVAELSAERRAHPVEVMIDLMLENENQDRKSTRLNSSHDQIS